METKLTAYVGIVAYALSPADYLRQAFTQSAAIALPLILLGALFLVIWFVLVGRRLWQLGRLEGKTPYKPF
jgi:cellobiose-specific phosphotransferase system component IIC